MTRDTQRVRDEVNAILDQIEQVKRGLPDHGMYDQAEDRECFEIIRRIERRLQGIEYVDPPTQPEAAE